MAAVTIDPVTRISGNAGIKVLFNEAGELEKASLQAYGYRGFEYIAKGAHIDNLMPVVSRICGGDALFHQLAAAEAVERALGVAPPQGAELLRELALWGQLFERHAVSLTVHSLPDLLFPSSDPGLRNIISIHKVDEEVIKRVMALKSLGTFIYREVGGRAVHAVNFLPGGAVRDIREEERKGLLERLDEARPLLIETGHLMKLLLRRNAEAVSNLGNLPTSYLALKGEQGMVLRGGGLEVLGPQGESMGAFSPGEAASRITESNSSHSHIRYADFEGADISRVGPLARLNVNRRYGTPLADGELEEVKEQWGMPLHQNMVSHVARILEMIHAWEMMRELLLQPAGEDMRRELAVATGTGTSMMEAPEGLLFYVLSLDEDGTVKELKIIAPLQFNLRALERTLEESAKNVLSGAGLEERSINLLEMAVRAYAPCIQCGVH